MRNILANLLNNKKLLSIIAILAVIIAVPLTVIISQKQQDLRQRASGKNVSFALSRPFNDSNVINLELDTKNYTVNGLDVTISFPQELEPTTVITNTGDENQTLTNIESEIRGQKVRIYGVSSSLDYFLQPGPKIILAQIQFNIQSGTPAGDYVISIEKADAVSPAFDRALWPDFNTLTYNIVAAAVPSSPPPPIELSINFESAVIDESNSGANLVVSYSKNFSDCAVLKKISNPPVESPFSRFIETPTPEPSIIPTAMHSKDLFCENNGPAIVPFSKFTSNIGSDMKVKLCNSNESACSKEVSVLPAPIKLNTAGTFSVNRWGGKNDDKFIGLGNSVLVTIPVENYSTINDYQIVPQCFFQRPSGIKTSIKGFDMIVRKGGETGLQLFFQPPQNDKNNGEWKVTDCSVSQSFFQTNKILSEPIIKTFNPSIYGWKNSFTVTGK